MVKIKTGEDIRSAIDVHNLIKKTILNKKKRFGRSEIIREVIALSSGSTFFVPEDELEERIGFVLAICCDHRLILKSYRGHSRLQRLDSKNSPGFRLPKWYKIGVNYPSDGQG